MRDRAAFLTPGQQTNGQDTRPALGQTSASKANRAGVAARFAAPAGPKSVAVALALLGHDAQRRRDVELSSLATAQRHDATTRSLLRAVPGIGERLRLVLRYDIHDIHRCPRGQACGSYGRLVTGPQASAGQRCGTAGPPRGNASLQWAFAEAAVLC
jgi:transposase